jgi:peptide/nickel transport system permease protein
VSLVPDIGFSSDIPADDDAGAAVDDIPSRDSRLRRFLSNRIAVAAFVVLFALIVVAALSVWVTPRNPNTQDLFNRLKRPGEAGLLGADEFGRDVLSRLMVGARVSLLAAAEACGVGAVIGIPLGLVAGFRGGWFDVVVGRVFDAVMSVPFLILALTVIAVVGYGLSKAMFVVGVVFAPSFFRVARGAAQEVARETFIEASTAIGCTMRRILLVHVVPNAIGPLFVQMAVAMGLGVSAEASLSFLGLGATPPTASWGGMLRSALANIRQAPFLMWFPGILVTVTVLALTLIGDGLRDAFGTRRIARRGRRR